MSVVAILACERRGKAIHPLPIPILEPRLGTDSWFQEKICLGSRVEIILPPNGSAAGQ